MAYAWKLRGEPRVGVSFIGDGGCEPRRVARDGQPRRGAEAAAGLRHREQPVGAGHARQRADGDAPLRAARRRATACRGPRSSATTPTRSPRVSRWAAERARAGRGPALIELVTYRRTGHAHHDDDRFFGNPEAKIAGYEHEEERAALGGARPHRALRGAAGGDGRRVARAPRLAARRGAGGGRGRRDAPRRRRRGRRARTIATASTRRASSRCRAARRAAHAHHGLRRGGAAGDQRGDDGRRARLRARRGRRRPLRRRLRRHPRPRQELRRQALRQHAHRRVGHRRLRGGRRDRGLRPVVEMQFADFLATGFNALVNNAAKLHWRWGRAVPMVVRLPYGGATGTGQRLLGGGPYHSQCPEMWFLRTPRLEDRRAVDAGGCEGPHARRDPRQQPGGVPGGKGVVRLLPHRLARRGAARRRARGRDRAR